MKVFFKKFFIILIKFYQYVLRPFLGANNCRFFPSCSEYTILAIKKFGVVKGLRLGFCRICRCHPYTKGGNDPVP